MSEHAELAHHFDDLEQQHEAAELGTWAFLVTEVLLFGGLFGTYAVYRHMHPEAFAHGSDALDVKLGAINTGVLIGSSLTMVLAVEAGRRRAGRAIAGWIAATIVLGAIFLSIKGVEYSHKWHEHLIPGPNFVFEGAPGGPAQIFFALYFVMTGLHASHMLVGIGLLAWCARKALRGEFSGANSNWVEMSGLYWHFVDLVWIFLFPLLYLVGRHP